jgi:hypothetical protein
LVPSLVESPPALGVPDDGTLRKNLKGARLMLAAGVGLTLGGLAGLAMGLTKRDCHGDDNAVRFKAPLAAGAVVTGVGVAFTFGGGFRSARIPSDYRAKHPPSAGIVGLGMGLAAGTALLMLLSSLPEAFGCARS